MLGWGSGTRARVVQRTKVSDDCVRVTRASATETDGTEPCARATHGNQAQLVCDEHAGGTWTARTPTTQINRTRLGSKARRAPSSAPTCSCNNTTFYARPTSASDAVQVRPERPRSSQSPCPAHIRTCLPVYMPGRSDRGSVVLSLLESRFGCVCACARAREQRLSTPLARPCAGCNLATAHRSSCLEKTVSAPS